MAKPVKPQRKRKQSRIAPPDELTDSHLIEAARASTKRQATRNSIAEKLPVAAQLERAISDEVCHPNIKEAGRASMLRQTIRDNAAKELSTAAPVDEMSVDEEDGSSLEESAHPPAEPQVTRGRASDELPNLSGQMSEQQEAQFEDAHLESPTRKRLESDGVELVEVVGINPSLHAPEGQIVFADMLRPSGSPAKVTGRRITRDTLVVASMRGNYCVVDKTLICKGFWDVAKSVERIFLPRRFGKSFNMSLIRQCFSSGLHYEDFRESRDVDEFDGMDVDPLPKEYQRVLRQRRLEMFNGSILMEECPYFVNEHFGQHPVIHLDFSRCVISNRGELVQTLCAALIETSEYWLDERQRTVSNKGSVNFEAEEQLLRRIIESAYNVGVMSDNKASGQGNTVVNLFEALSSFVFAWKRKKYILLVDEYDVPFITASESNWGSEGDGDAAMKLLWRLFSTMLKSNRKLEKGLIVGVFEVQLSKINSGINNLETIRLITLNVTDSNKRESKHDRKEMDALADAFGFNQQEVELLLDQIAAEYPVLEGHKECVQAAIRKWYNGYHLGRFSGKYNPWSVVNLLINLGRELPYYRGTGGGLQLSNIAENCAKDYWVESGSTTVLEKQIELNRRTIWDMVKRLMDSFNAENGYQGIDLDPQQVIWYVMFDSVNMTSVNLNPNSFTADSFIYTCLNAGYLTMKTCNSVTIPNREVYRVWEGFFLRASFLDKVTNLNDSNLRRGGVLQELLDGKTNLLEYFAKVGHGVLSNHNDYKEHEYANLAVTAFESIGAFGVYSPAEGRNKWSDYVVVQEPHTGHGQSDMIIYLHDKKGDANAFGLVVEFKWVPKEHLENDEKIKELAWKALKQIGDKDYTTSLIGCTSLFKVGMAIGRDVVHAYGQLSKRNGDSDKWKDTDSL